jgi:rhamnosyl/mannosyltransferase
MHLRWLAPGFDMVALHAPFPLADLANYLGAFRNTSLVVHWHSEIVRQTMFKVLYASPICKSLERARAVIISGERLVEPSSFLRNVREKCHVVPLGVDVQYWNDLSVEQRSYVDRIRAKHPRLILAVGRLVSYKGFHVLIDAMQWVDGELWIVGEGKMREFLRQHAAAGTAERRIRFLGEVSQTELRCLYHAARMLAFPSITAAETFGLVQLEAMACGLPVVNTWLDTVVPHVARDMREALTVPPHDSVSLASAIGRVLDDPALHASLGQAARVRAMSSFTERAFLDGIASVYEGVLTGRL